MDFSEHKLSIIYPSKKEAKKCRYDVLIAGHIYIHKIYYYYKNKLSSSAGYTHNWGHIFSIIYLALLNFTEPQYYRCVFVQYAEVFSKNFI